MAPTLLLSTWRKPRAPTTLASASVANDSNSISNEKVQFKENQRSQPWAPSQVIRLQRIERQERESFRADERVRNSVLEVISESHNNNEDEEFGEASPLQEQSEIQDFEVDEVFHLSPATCPNMCGSRGPEPSSPRLQDSSNNNNSQTDQLKLKIFTGSWNMAAKDPFADEKGQYVGDAMAALSLIEFLPLGYDLYVLGTQEKVTKHLHSAVLARLNATSANVESSPSLRFVRLDLNAPLADSRSVKSSQSVSPSLAVSRSRVANNSDFISDSVLRASSFGLTTSSFTSSSSGIEGLSSSSYIDTIASDAATTPSDSVNRAKQPKQHRSAHEVRGRGDGAFLHSKSTSLAIYVAAHIEPAVEVLRVGAHKFSLTSGSKGGLAVMLRVAGDQSITFVNCHLEANKPALRRQQLATLTTKLPKAMGFGDGQLDLAACSDHVVWMGDFNYRIHSLDGETVLKLLGSNRHMELHDRYDSMKDDVAFVSGMQQFSEPRKWPSFYPTYKKLPNRPSSVVTQHNPSWPLQVYRVRYKEPFYKGGRVKARVPGWCDRILHCSKPAWQSYLAVEQVPWDDGGTASDGHTNEIRENYRSVNDALRGSDHSPVFCTFELTTIGTGGYDNQPVQ